MASSDVIELGSSDDEAEPVPKKKKPTPNAMVQFPNEVTGLVINPVKAPLPNLQKVLAGGAITITNVRQGKANTQINKAKFNGRPVQSKSVLRPQTRQSVTRHIPMTPIRVKNNLSVNPLNMINSPRNIYRCQAPKLSLPPGIIVKRAAVGQRPLQNVNILPKKTKQIFKKNQPAKIVTTVELDDEEVPLTSGTNPQWYLRPEEQTPNEPESEQNNVIEKLSDMEVENNREPDVNNYIEITIEDSPIKPIHTMKGFEVGSQIPITIEDSPIKPPQSLKEQPCVSDGEAEETIATEKQSKKKLDYTKNEDMLLTDEANIVEFDLERVPIGTENNEKSQDKQSNELENTSEDAEVQIIGKPRPDPTVSLTKVKGKNDTGNVTTEVQLKNNDSNEFHPTYRAFIDLCFKLENSDDMNKIVEKKIKTYYRQCPKEYVESEEFIDMVSIKIFAMKSAPDKMYLYIKDIVDELNLQRKTAKALELCEGEKEKAGNNIVENPEIDSKHSRQIRKLEKAIKKLHRAIQKLEEQEVDFEDEEDSVYLLTERYKERLIRVHAKFCQLTNTKMPSESRIQIEPRTGQPPGPARRLEKWVNKKVPIGKPLPFPDFHDVLRCVRDANDEDGLGWNEADIMEEARDLFTRCGKKLQRRRQENEWRIAASRMPHDALSVDPAEKSDDLKKKLEENKSLASKKVTDLVDKYADKQNQLKLVGEEIGDKEAEESPVESEDESSSESNSLEDTQKRKNFSKKPSSVKDVFTNVQEKVNEKEGQLKNQEAMECEVENSVNESDQTEKENIKDDIKESTANVFQDGSSNYEKTPTINEINDVNCNNESDEKCNNSDTHNVDSDTDDMDLLHELKYKNCLSSQETDSDTPISTSDSLESGSDIECVEIHQNDEIISIENSSYSESEMHKDECESARESEFVKGDKNCGFIIEENVETESTIFRGKIDVDDEDVLLASSGDECKNDHFHTDEISITIPNAGIINNIDSKDYTIADNSCDESLLQSKEKPVEVAECKTSVSETDEIAEKYSDHVNMLENNERITNEQPTEPLENDMEVDIPFISEVSIKMNNDNIELTSCSSNSLMTKEIGSNEDVSIPSETEIKKSFENSTSDELQGNYSEVTQRNHDCLNNVEVNVKSSTVFNSEPNNVDLNATLMNQIPNNVSDNDVGAADSVEIISKEKETNKCTAAEDVNEY